MIIYTVTSIIKQEIETDWLKWMRYVHIQDIMKAGYFKDFKLYKVIIPTTSAGEINYVTQYECESFQKYSEYAEKDSARFRAEYGAKFPGKAKVARTVMEQIT